MVRNYAANSNIELSVEKLWMRILLYFIAIVALASCKKESAILDFKKKMAGTWEVEKRVDITGTQVFQPGNGDIIFFDSKGYYERRNHFTLILAGQYIIKQQEDCMARDSEISIKLSEVSSGNYQYVEIKEGKLVFSTSNCYSDGAMYSYRRLP